MGQLVGTQKIYGIYELSGVEQGTKGSREQGEPFANELQLPIQIDFNFLANYQTIRGYKKIEKISQQLELKFVLCLTRTLSLSLSLSLAVSIALSVSLRT